MLSSCAVLPPGRATTLSAAGRSWTHDKCRLPVVNSCISDVMRNSADCRIQKIPWNIAEKREKLHFPETFDVFTVTAKPTCPCDFQNQLARYILELSIFSTRILHHFVSEFIGITNLGGIAQIQSVLRSFPLLAEFGRICRISAEFTVFSRRILHGISDILPWNSRGTEFT